MAKRYDIRASSSQVGAIGQLGTHAHWLTITVDDGEDVNARAIAAHYLRYPNLQHVKIVHVILLGDVEL